VVVVGREESDTGIVGGPNCAGYGTLLSAPTIDGIVCWFWKRRGWLRPSLRTAMVVVDGEAIFGQVMIFV